MGGVDLSKEIALAEEKLKNESYDFTAKYLAAAELHGIAEKNPLALSGRTISVLEETMGRKGFARQRQGFFLFRETARALGALIANRHDSGAAERVFTVFKRILASVTGHAHRAAAEALGALPVKIKGPRLPDIDPERTPLASLDDIVRKTTMKAPSPPVFFGRSMVIACKNTNRLLVLKFARPSDSPEALAKEILWMDHMRSGGYCFSRRFDIPETLHPGGRPVFRLRHPPAGNGEKLHPKRYAIAFSAHGEYFKYPNDPAAAGTLCGKAFAEVIFRNAWLSGKLASRGVVHSALIPLFHNRVQRARRRDRGLYEWFRAGRLDRWLHSCDHPNMGFTGLRDFEHLFTYDDQGLSLYRHLGGHFLSFFLLTGSYFRNKDKKRLGLEKDGNPVDARALFDAELLEEMIPGVFRNYYKGFTGSDYTGELPVDAGRLAARMIDEMGVDRHMEEILRVADQNEMSDGEFRSFLSERGFSADEIGKFEKGADEIAIQTGPHLGGFNRQISIPELIEAVAAMSGVCIAGKFWRENFGKRL